MPEVVTVMPWLGAAFFLVIAPVAVLVIRPHPVASSEAGEQTLLSQGWRYSTAVRSRFFSLVTIAYILCRASQVGGIALVATVGTSMPIAVTITNGGSAWDPVAMTRCPIWTAMPGTRFVSTPPPPRR